MQFTTKADVEAPLDVVFAALMDFDGWERAAVRRGADVVRTHPGPGAGMAWNAQFTFRGKGRSFDIRLVTVDPAAKLGFAGTGTMLEGDMGVEVVALTPKRTRMVVVVDVRALNLGARLLLQTMKLGRSSVQAKLTKRMEALARDIEARHAAMTGAA